MGQLPFAAPFRPPDLSRLITASLVAAAILLSLVLFPQWLMKQQRWEALRVHVGEIGQLAASVVDGDLHHRLLDPANYSDELYARALKPLVRFHSAYPSATYIYTMVDRGGIPYFVLDTAASPDLRTSHKLQASAYMERFDIRERYKGNWLEQIAAGKTYVTNTFQEDEYGSFLTAHVPIYDSKQDYSGFVGVDFDPRFYLAQEARFDRVMAASAGIALIAAAGIGYLLTLFGSISRSRAAELVSVAEQREQVNVALEDALARRSAIMDVALDCIVTIDQEGFVLEFNPAAEKTFGYKRDMALGRRMSELIVPEDYRERHKIGIDKFLKTGEHNVLGNRIEVPALKADGSIIPIELAITPIHMHDKYIFTAYIREISDRKRFEQEILDAKNKAETANEAKSRFLAMMSHEIRTPLNAVLGFLNMLQQTRLDAEQSNMVRIARESGEALLGIILDILDFSRIAAGNLNLEEEVFEVVGLFDGVMEVIHPQEEQGRVDLTLRVADDVPAWMTGYPGRLRQVVLNLVSNAVKFTEKGRIAVTVTVAARDGDRITVRCEVADTGIGIPENMQGQMFNEFTVITPSLSRHFGGTGLGLAICKRIVELAGGNIGFTSKAGVGSTFWFTAPMQAAEPPPAAEPEAEEAARDDSGKSLRILVADDNQSNLLVAKAMLERAGHHVDAVVDGTEVLAALRRSSYDCVLMDVAMPELDGLATSRAIRVLDGDPARTPIVAMTAYAAVEDRRSIFASGMDGHVTKPVRAADMLKAIARAIRKREPSGDEGAPVLDFAALTMLEEAVGKDQARSIIASFLDGGNLTIQAMCAAAAAPVDKKTLEREAHKLSGGSTQIGARLVQTEAEAIEEACRRGDATAAVRRIPALSRQWQKASRMLRRRLARIDTGAGTTDGDTRLER